MIRKEAISSLFAPNQNKSNKGQFQQEVMQKQGKVVQDGDEWVVYTSDENRILGKHKSKEKALEQERAIWASKNASRVFGE